MISSKTREILYKAIEKDLGIPYNEFIKLDFDEQQKIIEQSKQRKAKEQNDIVRVMIDNGEDSLFLFKNKDEKYSLADGTLARAGDTLEESIERINKKIDDAYNSTLSLAKKLSNKINNK